MPAFLAIIIAIIIFLFTSWRRVLFVANKYYVYEWDDDDSWILFSILYK